jgi:hypothetical protein
MTDRYNAFIVILERDIREDDAEDTITAIKQIRGVLKVVPNNADPTEAIARARAKQEIAEKIWEALKC